MSNYNDIGLAIANLELRSNNALKPSNNSVDQYAKSNGLTLDKKFTSSIAEILDKFHGNVMEIIIETDSKELDVGFKALLNKEHLRLSPNDLRNLYGYKPCMNWTMVGEVTNISYFSNTHQAKTKSLFSDMFEKLDVVDQALLKTSEDSNNIIRISPIAVYIEH